MSEHRFHLEKYRPGNRYECPGCGRRKCFSRYVDEQGEITFPEHVGRCDHESSCGYHYSPKDYFRDNPDKRPLREARGQFLPSAHPVPPVPHATTSKRQGAGSSFNKFVPLEAVPSYQVASSCDATPSFIDNAIVERSLCRYDTNPLFIYLAKVIGHEETAELFARYRVGTSKEWGGSCVFWQTDISGHVRSGKIMRYDPKTGHRIKGETDRVTWVHARLHLHDFRLRQCFFGEHLLARYPNKPVAIVESEKTALIAARFIKDPLWIATGGMHGCLNNQAVSVLKGRRVTLFPDLGAEDVWRKKLSLFTSVCQSVTMSDILQRNATEEQRRRGLDLADFLLMEESKQMVLEKMIALNPALQLLIDKLDLVLVEEEEE